jgi:plasmid segregation protein ParM
LRVLFYAALVELGAQGKIALCTGLPVDWFGDRENLERALLGDHRFMADGEPWQVKVCQVVIVPQPFGSFFDQALDQSGDVINAGFVRGKVGILDVGTFTTDLALSDGLEYIAKGSGSRTVAMSTVWRQVRDGIKERFGIEYGLHYVDHIVRNGQAVTVQGRDHDVSDLVAGAVENLADQVIALARDRWGRALDFKRLIVTGGGAYYLADHVRAVYPHAITTHTPDQGNLRGFYKYAVRKFAR